MNETILHVRLTGEINKKFERLKMAYSGLGTSALIKIAINKLYSNEYTNIADIIHREDQNDTQKKSDDFFPDDDIPENKDVATDPNVLSEIFKKD
jgi:hypothetical protein